jgi:hypothetical protein
MATKAISVKRRKGTPRRRPQRHIDATNYVESRRTWEPDLDELEGKLEKINRKFLCIYSTRAKQA